MDLYVGPMTDSLLTNISNEIKKKKNREKIMKNIIGPVLEDINKKYYPHFVSIISLFIMMILLLISLLILSIYTKK
jgi:hypothetical protein